MLSNEEIVMSFLKIIFKSLYWICYNIAFIFCFGVVFFFFFFFGREACGILVPQLGIKPSSPALEDEVLTTGPPGNPWHVFPYFSFQIFIVQEAGIQNYFNLSSFNTVY